MVDIGVMRRVDSRRQRKDDIRVSKAGEVRGRRQSGINVIKAVEARELCDNGGAVAGGARIGDGGVERRRVVPKEIGGAGAETCAKGPCMVTATLEDAKVCGRRGCRHAQLQRLTRGQGMRDGGGGGGTLHMDGVGGRRLHGTAEIADVLVAGRSRTEREMSTSGTLHNALVAGGGAGREMQRHAGVLSG